MKNKTIEIGMTDGNEGKKKVKFEGRNNRKKWYAIKQKTWKQE